MEMHALPAPASIALPDARLLGALSPCRALRQARVCHNRSAPICDKAHGRLLDPHAHLPRIVGRVCVHTRVMTGERESRAPERGPSPSAYTDHRANRLRIAATLEQEEVAANITAIAATCADGGNYHQHTTRTVTKDRAGAVSNIGRRQCSLSK